MTSEYHLLVYIGRGRSTPLLALYTRRRWKRVAMQTSSCRADQLGYEVRWALPLAVVKRVPPESTLSEISAARGKRLGYGH